MTTKALRALLAATLLVAAAPAAIAQPARAPATMTKANAKAKPFRGLQPVGLKGCDLKAVDFKSAKFVRGPAKLHFKDGTGGLLPARDHTNYTYALRSVTFADTNGNGIEEALLNFAVEAYYHGDFERTDVSSEVFVLENDAACKIRTIGVATIPLLSYGTAKIASRKLEMHFDGDAIVELGWTNGEFVEVGRRPLSAAPR